MLYQSGKLVEEEFTTYKERRASSRKMLQRIRNVLLDEDVQTYSFKLLEEDVTTCQERLASYLQKISQRIRNVLQVTRRRCYNVSGTSVKLFS